jgi:hypothetical protein
MKRHKSFWENSIFWSLALKLKWKPARLPQPVGYKNKSYKFSFKNIKLISLFCNTRTNISKCFSFDLFFICLFLVFLGSINEGDRISEKDMTENLFLSFLPPKWNYPVYFTEKNLAKDMEAWEVATAMHVLPAGNCPINKTLQAEVFLAPKHVLWLLHHKHPCALSGHTFWP